MGGAKSLFHNRMYIMNEVILAFYLRPFLILLALRSSNSLQKIGSIRQPIIIMIMGTSSLPSIIHMPSSHTEKPSTHNSYNFFQIGTSSTRTYTLHSSSCRAIHKSVPLAATSIAVLLWSTPAHAGFMSGISGIESIPGPELPQIDFLKRLNEENQKKYAENDARFQSSPLLKKLLEQSKQNKEKNRQAIENKYCIRGAEWGVGDCSAEGMSPEEREKFIAMLKQKAEEK